MGKKVILIKNNQEIHIMNTKSRLILMVPILLLTGTFLWLVYAQAASKTAGLAGGAPQVISYQGEVRVSSIPHSGTGYFKFAVVNAAGDTTYWSNDGSSSGGSMPTAAVALGVSEGLFSVLLGDTSTSGMTQALSADIFSQPNRFLRVWFSTSPGGPFSQLVPDTRMAAVPYALQAQSAADADTVDGLHASELGTHYQNVVVVAKSGGDYTSIQAAIDSITDAESYNPYLVWAAPGVYDEQVTMKPNVHLQGAGQEATIITSNTSNGSWPPTQATVLLASDTSLRDLSIRNYADGNYNAALLATTGMTGTSISNLKAHAQGPGIHNYAIYLSGIDTSIILKEVTALAEGGDFNIGFCNQDGAAATLHGGSFTGRNGDTAIGIYNDGTDSRLTAESVTALGIDGINVYGLHNNDGLARLHASSITGGNGIYTHGIANSGTGVLEAVNVTSLARDGNEDSIGLDNTSFAILQGGNFTGINGVLAYGIRNEGTLETRSTTAIGTNATTNYGIYNAGQNAILEAYNVTVVGENGATNYGLFADLGSIATISQSVLEGSTATVYLVQGSVEVSNSRLIDGPVVGPVSCVAVSRNSAFSTGPGCP